MMNNVCCYLYVFEIRQGKSDEGIQTGDRKETIKTTMKVIEV